MFLSYSNARPGAVTLNLDLLAVKEARGLKLCAGSGFAGNSSCDNELQCKGLVLPIQVLEIRHVNFVVDLHAACENVC